MDNFEEVGIDAEYYYSNDYVEIIEHLDTLNNNIVIYNNNLVDLSEFIIVSFGFFVGIVLVYFSLNLLKD